jgi:hypothetical protein
MTHEALSTYRTIHSLYTCTRLYFSQQIKSFITFASYGRLELVIQFAQHLYQHHYSDIAIFWQVCNYSSLKSHNVPVHNTTDKGPKLTTCIMYGNVHQNIEFVSFDFPSTAQTELWTGCLWNMSPYLYIVIKILRITEDWFSLKRLL